MNIFDHIDPQALIILVVMIIGALRWILENVRKKRENPEEEQNAFEDLYEEARREVLERQQQVYPDQEVVQEKLSEYSQPSVFQPRPTMPPAATKTAPPPLPGKRPAYDNSAPPPSVRRTILNAAEKAALKRFQARGESRPKPRRSGGHSRVRELLSSPSSARDAIVLHEILGPPKGASGAP